jgi:hypothetical protein
VRILSYLVKKHSVDSRLLSRRKYRRLLHDSACVIIGDWRCWFDFISTESELNSNLRNFWSEMRMLERPALVSLRESRDAIGFRGSEQDRTDARVKWQSPGVTRSVCSLSSIKNTLQALFQTGNLLTEKKEREGRKNGWLRSFIICKHHEILLEWTDQENLRGRDTNYASGHEKYMDRFSRKTESRRHWWGIILKWILKT